jgi:hypothetical protein
MPRMTDPADEAAPRPSPGAGEPTRAPTAEPGERPPAGRLSRPPSERYARPSVGGSASPGAKATAASKSTIAGVLGPAIAAALVTAALVVLVGGVLAEHSGLLFITGLGSGATGLLVARGAVSPDGAAAPVWSRQVAMRVATGLGLATVVVAAIGIWIVSRLQGGVMDPLPYLAETTGLLLPALATVAAIAAAIGASMGPVRGRP